MWTWTPEGNVGAATRTATKLWNDPEYEGLPAIRKFAGSLQYNAFPIPILQSRQKWLSLSDLGCWQVSVRRRFSG
jgi:hypothetical protein